MRGHGKPHEFKEYLLADWLLQGFAIVFGAEASADHELVQLADVCVGDWEIGHDLAVLHHIDAVRELQNLIEPVRNEDEGGARPQGADTGEKDVDLGVFEHRGRLVEEYDEMSRRVLLKGQCLG